REVQAINAERNRAKLASRIQNHQINKRVSGRPQPSPKIFPFSLGPEGRIDRLSIGSQLAIITKIRRRRAYIYYKEFI
ncbi:MAG: hypothetical protein ACXVCD_19550, partial [Pseudobdellovibrionaceae bacterium]